MVDHIGKAFRNQVIETTPDDYYENCLFVRCAFHGYGPELVNCRIVNSREDDVYGMNLINCTFIIY